MMGPRFTVQPCADTEGDYVVIDTVATDAPEVRTFTGAMAKLEAEEYARLRNAEGAE